MKWLCRNMRPSRKIFDSTFDSTISLLLLSICKALCFLNEHQLGMYFLNIQMTKFSSTMRQPSPTQTVAKKHLKTHLKRIRNREYCRLRDMVPAIANKQKVSKVGHRYLLDYQCLPLITLANNLDPEYRRALSGSKLFDILMVFLNNLKVN